MSHDAFLAALFDDDRWLAEQALDKDLHDQECDCDIEYRLRRPENSIRFVRQRGKTIPGAGRVPRKMVGSRQDITEKKITAEQLELRTQRYRFQNLEAIGTMAGDQA